MYRHLFRSRWFALAFVLMMVASAASLVGTEKHDGMIDRATAQLHSQKAAFDAEAADLARPSHNAQVITLDEPLPEDDLIDPGIGFDPTPPDPSGYDPDPEFDPAPAE